MRYSLIFLVFDLHFMSENEVYLFKLGSSVSINLSRYSTFGVNEVHQFYKVGLKIEVQSVTVPHQRRICCMFTKF
jgi:hypothetical protein